MTHFRMCTDKVRFATAEEALAEASLQAAQHPHWAWAWYDCLWCDYLHIGRATQADGHGVNCLDACERQARQGREQRILEGVW